VILNVLYVATGKKYLDEATKSIDSLLRSVTEYKIAVDLITSTEDEYDNIFEDSVVVTKIPKNNAFAFKIAGLNFFNKADKFLFLDTDTCVCCLPSNIDRLFEAAPLCAVADPLVSTWDHNNIIAPEGWRICEYIPEINSGVMFINRAHKCYNNFIEEWVCLHRELSLTNKNKATVPDQASLMEVIHRKCITPFYLQNNYNFRACYPQSVYGTIYIVHSHTPNPHKFADKFRGNEDMVILFPWGLKISRRGLINRPLYWLYRVFCK